MLQVLRDNNEAFGWSIHDIKGLNPTICTHRINIKEGFPPKRLSQRKLNPNMMEVVIRDDAKSTFNMNTHRVKVYYEEFQ